MFFTIKVVLVIDLGLSSILDLGGRDSDAWAIVEYGGSMVAPNALGPKEMAVFRQWV